MCNLYCLCLQSRTAGGARAFLHRLSGHNDDSLAVSSAGLGGHSGCHTGPSPSPSCAALPAMPEESGPEVAAHRRPSSPSSSAFADRAERPSKRDKYNKARCDAGDILVHMYPTNQVNKLVQYNSPLTVTPVTVTGYKIIWFE